MDERLLEQIAIGKAMTDRGFEAIEWVRVTLAGTLTGVSQDLRP